jgi:hypothetical protein
MAERRRAGGRSGWSDSGGSGKAAGSRKAGAAGNSGTSRKSGTSRTSGAARKYGASAKSGASRKTRPSSGSAPSLSQEKDRSRVRGTAPSAADVTKLDKFEPSEEAKRHEPSDVDAMGQDKRRQVVGHSYGPSRRSQILFFAIVAAVIVVTVGGWTLAVAAFDTAPENYPDEAPWSEASALAKPTRSPAGPCGEPGNPYPPPAGSPCAAQTGGGSTEGEPTAPGRTGGLQEEGPGGAVGGTSESQATPD